MSEKIELGKKLVLRVDLQPEIAQILKGIMEERKFQYFSNAIRYCIVETQNKAEYKLEEPFSRRIDNYLSKNFVHRKLLITSKQQFVNKALEHYFEYIDRNSPSIMSFDVRKSLNQEENEIALALIECQIDNPANEVTLDAIMEKINSRNDEKIKGILSKFVEDGILDMVNREGTRYYHAAQV